MKTKYIVKDYDDDVWKPLVPSGDIWSSVKHLSDVVKYSKYSQMIKIKNRDGVEYLAVGTEPNCHPHKAQYEKDRYIEIDDNEDSVKMCEVLNL